MKLQVICYEIRKFIILLRFDLAPLSRLRRSKRGVAQPGPVPLWRNEFETRAEAMKIEKKIKGIKKREGIKRFVIENNFRGVAQPG